MVTPCSCGEPRLRVWTPTLRLMFNFLCGRGLQETKDFLARHPSDDASRALGRLLASEESGDFHDFDVVEYSTFYDDYYGNSVQGPSRTG